jgi:hypothetical protein
MIALIIILLFLGLLTGIFVRSGKSPFDNIAMLAAVEATPQDSAARKLLAEELARPARIKKKRQGLWLFIGAILFGALIYSAMTSPAPAQQTVFRDDRGSTVGTAVTTGNQTTYRDDRGRTTGTSTIDSAGTTTFRDERGRTVGTATAPRQW